MIWVIKLYEQALTWHKSNQQETDDEKVNTVPSSVKIMTIFIFVLKRLGNYASENTWNEENFVLEILTPRVRFL